MSENENTERAFPTGTRSGFSLRCELDDLVELPDWIGYTSSRGCRLLSERLVGTAVGAAPLPARPGRLPK